MLALEVALGALPLVRVTGVRQLLLIAGVTFHAGTFLMLGLASFGLIMIAVLVLFESAITELWSGQEAPASRDVHRPDPDLASLPA